MALRGESGSRAHDQPGEVVLYKQFTSSGTALNTMIYDGYDVRAGQLEDVGHNSPLKKTKKTENPPKTQINNND